LENKLTLDDIKSLSEKTREDGKRLFGVCEFIYTIAIIGIFFVAIVGGIVALIAMNQLSVLFGLGIALIVLIICFVNYVIAVLTTHIGKVMVHTSFASVAILEHLNKSQVLEFENNQANSSNSIESIQVVDIDDVSRRATKVLDKLSKLGYELSDSMIDAQKQYWKIIYKDNGSTCEFYSIEDFETYAKNF